METLFSRGIKSKELFLTGTIDCDDYLAIQADCEHKINALGEDLKTAMLMSMKKDKIIARLENIYDHLVQSYKELYIPGKREVISLLCENRVLYYNGVFKRLFRFPVFNLYGVNNYHKNPNSYKNFQQSSELSANIGSFFAYSDIKIRKIKE